MNKSEHTPLPLPLPLPCPPNLIPTHTLTTGSRTRTPSPGPGPLPLHLTLQIAGDDQPHCRRRSRASTYRLRRRVHDKCYRAQCLVRSKLCCQASPEVPGPTRSFCHPPCRLHPTSRRNNYDVRKST